MIRLPACLLGVIAALSAATSQAAISLSFSSNSEELIIGASTQFTVFLDVTGALPDPTVPPDTVATPISDFSFSVEASSGDGGTVNFTAANVDGAFAGGTANGGSNATFNWSGPAVNLTNQVTLGTFTVQAATNGTINLQLLETTAGNNPMAPGAITSDFIFLTPSDPIGGDDQLFTDPGGPGGRQFSSASLAISAVPEPSSAMLFGLGAVGLGMVRRRRR